MRRKHIQALLALSFIFTISGCTSSARPATSRQPARKVSESVEQSNADAGHNVAYGEGGKIIWMWSEDHYVYEVQGVPVWWGTKEQWHAWDGKSASPRDVTRLPNYTSRRPQSARQR